MFADPWFLVAVGCSLAGYASYLVGLRRELVQPNRASWLIWSVATGVEAATYAAVNPGSPQAVVFLVSAAACLLVTTGLWRRAAWELPTRTEATCMAASLAALIVWLVYRETFWAHLLVVAAVPISFWPTWVSAWTDPRRETSPAWGLWTVGDLATLIVAGRFANQGVGEFAYVGVELLVHASVWFMIGLATINPLRAFARHRAHHADAFVIRETHLGRSVFAASGFAPGQPIVEFTGRRFHADRIASLLRGRSDRFVQVGRDHYMGPSGRIDDLINHSCAPNAGLRFGSDGVVLVAIGAIAAGEENTWDYSTTLLESNWHMICQCRSPDCRRVIGNFATLSDARQEWFRSHNLVAPYLRRRDTPGQRAA